MSPENCTHSFEGSEHILLIRTVALGTDDNSTPCIDFVVVFIHGKCSISYL